MTTPAPLPDLYDSTAESWCSGLDSAATHSAVLRAWQAGQVVGIAGGGQIVLTCTAVNAETIAELRQRTQLPTAPLTLLYHELFILAEDTEVGVADMLVLEARDGTSLWLTCQSDPLTPLDWSAIVPGLMRVPAALAPPGLYSKLLAQCQGPIVVLPMADGTAADFVLEAEESELQQVAVVYQAHTPLRQRLIVQSGAASTSYSSLRARMQAMVLDAAVLTSPTPVLLACWDEVAVEYPYWECRAGGLRALDLSYATPAQLLQEAARRCFPDLSFTYSSEAQLRLEAAAHRYFRQARPGREGSWLPEGLLPSSWPNLLLTHLDQALAAGHSIDYLAAGLHLSLADALGRLALAEGYQGLAVTGDYFLNNWLVDLLDLYWSKTLQLYYHQTLSPTINTT